VSWSFTVTDFSVLLTSEVYGMRTQCNELITPLDWVSQNEIQLKLVGLLFLAGEELETFITEGGGMRGRRK
jgi:hypothetical protein